MSKPSIDPLTDAERRMCEDNLPLAYWVCYRFINYHGRTACRVVYPEMVSHAFWALIKAARSYNPNHEHAPGKRTKFSTYATTCIWRELSTVMRRSYDQHVTNYRPLGPDALEGADDDMDLPGPSPAEGLQPDEMDKIARLTGLMSPRMQRVFYLRYWENRTLNEISQELNVSRERVRQILHAILWDLREAFGAPQHGCRDRQYKKKKKGGPGGQATDEKTT